jgi:hypothetical protein
MAFNVTRLAVRQPLDALALVRVSSRVDLGDGRTRGVAFGGRVLDQRHDAAGHEPRNADRGAVAGDLGHLDHRPTRGRLDTPAVARGDNVEAADTVTGVDHDLDPISAHIPIIPRIERMFHSDSAAIALVVRPTRVDQT